MQFLIPLAGLLGIEVDALKDRLARSALFFCLIGIFGVITATFLLVALHAWLVPEVGPVYAPLIIAGIALVLALLTWLTMALGNRSRATIAREHKRSADSTAFLTTAALTALPVLFRNSTARKVGLPLGALAAVLFLNRTEQNRDE